MCNCANLNDCGPYDHLMDDMSAMRSTGGYQRTLGDDMTSVTTTKKDTGSPEPIRLGPEPQYDPVTGLRIYESGPPTWSDLLLKDVDTWVNKHLFVVGAGGGVIAMAAVWAIASRSKRSKTKKDSSRGK